MLNQVKVCIQKQYWEIINNKKHFIISFLINIILLVILSNRLKMLLNGIDTVTILLIYFLLWIILMSFTIVNDIVSELSSDDIIIQVFLSSCKISKYTLIQIITRSFVSIVFITLLLLFCSIFLCEFSVVMLVSFVITVIIGFFSLLGISYLISTLALVFKNNNIKTVLRILFIYIIIRFDKNIFVPFTNCKIILEELFVDNKLLWEYNYVDILSLVLNSFIYFGVGFLLFRHVADTYYLFHHNLKDI